MGRPIAGTRGRPEKLAATTAAAPGGHGHEARNGGYVYVIQRPRAGAVAVVQLSRGVAAQLASAAIPAGIGWHITSQGGDADRASGCDHSLAM